ncbi:IgA peptidase M64 [Kutzneria buriramensis]|uniref:IgA peptidase M64 n=2 Tax=Kutzneria buriramensis TaxID=1045776 RepID=A0A3E0GYU1_9PSEU|nr:IgA peptidase M64 [Kutzneria buriramensis]
MVSALALLPVPIATAATGPATVVPIRVTGDPAKRFNLVVLGDGYTTADMPKFRADVDRHMNVLFTFEPFKSYRNYINVYSVEIPSAESGVSCDPDLTSPQRNTPLHMAFWSGCDPNGVQRALGMDGDAATAYANLVPGTTDANRQILAIANSTTYGGVGGTYATASGGNAMSSLITPHELGHSLGGLQDEYDYYARGVRGGAYTGGEPDSVHHTLLTEQEMKDQQKKWWRWLGEPSEAGGTIGRYESGMYSGSGVWRPSAHSIMKTLGYPYDQVGREDMTKQISAKTSIVQDTTPMAKAIGADRVVWVEPMHPNSHPLTITWSLDGKQLSANGQQLDLRPLNLKGKHKLTATVVDPTDFVRDPAIRQALTNTHAWSVDASIKTPPTTTPVTFTDTTETDRPVGADEVVFADTTHPSNQVVPVRWALDGKSLASTANDLDLKALRLTGTHTLTAAVGTDTRSWAVDATDPTTDYQLSNSLLTVRKADGTSEYVYNGPFTMKLTAADDRTGALTSEFRTDGDGWFNYFGWPSDSTSPWHFTPSGTEIDHLVYGKLGKPRLSPWDDPTPSYGQHTIEYRTTDAAGNTATAKSFQVNLLPAPPACTNTITGSHDGAIVVTDGVTCLDHAQLHGAIVVQPGASLVATGSTITGGISAANADSVELLDTTVRGAATIAGTAHDVTIVGGSVQGALALSGNNTGARQPVVAGVSVTGALTCVGNSPAPSNIAAPNTVRGGALGQCSSL